MNLAKVLICIEGAMINLGYVTNQDDSIKDACKLLEEAHDEITKNIET